MRHADSKLYIPMRYDGFYVIKPDEKAAEVLSHTTLEGEALGAPAVSSGEIYVHTTKKLYRFGSRSGSKPLPAEPQAGGRTNLYGLNFILRISFTPTQMKFCH